MDREKALEAFAKECMENFDYGTNEYCLAEAYLLMLKNHPLQNAISTAIEKDWARLGKENAALTQTARVDVDDRQLKEDVWKAIGKPSFSWGIISQTIDYITARYSLVEKGSIFTGDEE